MTTIEELMKELKELTVKVESFIKSKEDKEDKDNTEDTKDTEEDAFKNNKFNKKEDSESSSSTKSYPMSESGIDFFPAKYRTIHVNLNSNNVVITRADKIIQLNY
jgi:3-polyprenyl-4-hydroxybenzoate decarboxylase